MTAPLSTWDMIDLFSGIGGFSLAARWTGRIHTTAFCEIDPFCRSVLRKHWPHVPTYEDVRLLTPGALLERGVGQPDLLVGGFPCQGISIAGKGGGLEDARSGLWYEMLRIITDLQPRFLLIENVPRLRTLGADTVLEGLEAAGYACEALVVGADDIGAPHRRKRVWIAGRRVGERQALPEQPRLASEPRPGYNGGKGLQDGRPSASRASSGPPSGNDPLGVGLADPEGERCGEAWRHSGRSEEWPAIRGESLALAALRGQSMCGGAQRVAGQLERRLPEPGGEFLAPSQCSREVAYSDSGYGNGRAGSLQMGRGGFAGDAAQYGTANDESPVEPGLGLQPSRISRWLAGCRWPTRPGCPQEDWEAPRTGTKIPMRAMKLKALGNSIVPQVAYCLLMAMLEVWGDE